MNSRISSKAAPAPVMAIITIAIAIVLLIAAISISTALFKKINYLNNTWSNFQEYTVVKNTLATELSHTFLDNGLFGDLQRYVNNPDNSKREQITAKLSRIKEVIAQYKILNDLSVAETSNLITINNELTHLKNTFFLINKFIKHQESERYSSVINKLSPTEGQSAIDSLITFNHDQSMVQTKQINGSINTLITLAIATLLLVPVVIFFICSYWAARHKVSSDILAKNNRDELHKLFKYTAVPTVIVNRSGDIISANNGACDLTGYSLNHLLSKHLEQIVSNNSSGFFKQIMTLNKLEKMSETTTLITNKEQEIRVDVDITQMIEGTHLLSIVSFRNIEALQQSVENQHNYLEMHGFSEAVKNVGCWRWDFSNDQLTWSEKTYDFYGFSKDETQISQEIILSCIPSNEREDVGNAINESIIFGNELNIKHHIQHTNGKLIYVHQQGCIIKTDAGKSRYMLGSISLAEYQENEITEQEATETPAINQAPAIPVEGTDEISDRVFNFSLDAMAITDNQNTIIRINDAFTKTTGFSEEDVLGKQLSNVNRATFFDQSIYDKINQQLQDSQSWTGELWNVRKNGDVYPTTQHICAISFENDIASRYLCTFRDISENKALEERIINSRAIDTLTMLPSRSVLQDRLNQSIKRHERDKNQSAVLIISIKPLIENIEEQEHNQLIKIFAQRLSQITRDHDTIARFGHWEFVVLLEGLPLAEDAYVVAEKIQMKLSETVVVRELTFTPQVDLGISLHPLHATNDETLIQYADAAMQQAKSSISHNIQTFNKHILELFNKEQHLNTQLQRAIDLKELSVNYQPVINCQSQKVVRCVAHVRWHHRAYNSTYTKKFISSAKHGSLSKPLHDWLLKNALKYATQWSNSGLSTIQLQIKVVTSQLKEPGLAQTVKDLLNTYQYPPEQLILEIAQDDLVLQESHVVAELSALADIGVEVMTVNVDQPPHEQLDTTNAHHALINRYSMVDIQQDAEVNLSSNKVIDTLKESDIYPANYDWKDKLTIDIFKNLQTNNEEKLLVCGSIDSQSIILLGQKLQNITS